MKTATHRTLHAQIPGCFAAELRELIEAKIKGLPRQKPRPVEEPGKVIDLMAMLRKSLGEGPARGAMKAPAKAGGKKRTGQAGQASLLLPIEGKGKGKAEPKIAEAKGAKSAEARGESKQPKRKRA